MHRILPLLGLVPLVLPAACVSTKDDDGTKQGQDFGDAASSEGDAGRVAGDESEEESDHPAPCVLTHPERLTGECPENYVCLPPLADGSFCARRLRTYEECRSWGGEIVSIPDAGGDRECPETHWYIGVVFENEMNAAYCCEPVESHCTAHDATYEGSSPCGNGAEEITGIQWDGQACARKTGCTCVGADCNNGMSMSDCEFAYSVCADL